MKDRPEMRNSYQIGQGPETPWWERKGRNKQYLRFASTIKKTRKNIPELEFKRSQKKRRCQGEEEQNRKKPIELLMQDG